MRLKHYLRGLGIGIVVTLIFTSVYHSGRDTEMTDEQIIARAKELGMIEKTTLGNMDSSNPGDSQGETSDGETSDDKTSQEGASDGDTSEDETGDTTPAVPDTSEDGTGDTTPTVPDTSTDNTLGEDGQKPDINISDEEQNEPGVDADTSDEGQNTTGADTDTPDEEQDGTEGNESSSKNDSQETGNKEDNSDNTEIQYVTILVERGDASYKVCQKLAEAGVIENAREFDSYLAKNGYDKRIRTGSHQVPVGGSYEDIAKAIASN